jgi:hypothetical protein
METHKGKSLNTKALVAYSADSIVSKTVVDTKAGTITLFAFDGGVWFERARPID